MKKITSFLTLILISALFLMVGADISHKLNMPFLQIPIAAAIFAICYYSKPKHGITMNAFTEGICEAVQTTMLNLFGTNAAELQRTQLGWIQSEMSSINMAGMTIIPIDQGNGKTRTVRITYIQRGTEDDIIDVKPTDCSTNKEPAPFEDIVSITQWHGKDGIKFDATEMRKLCETDNGYMGRVLNAQLDALTKSLDKKLITDLASNFGAFNPALGDPGLWKDVFLLDEDKNYSPVYFGESTILEDFSNIDYTGKPIVVGAGNLSHYIRQISIGCCNDNGINLSMAGNLYYFRDPNMDTILGANHFAAYKPGSVQLITKNDFLGEYAKESPTFSHGTLVDPFTNIRWDIKWHYNDCDDTYSLQIGVWYKQYFLPDNIFADDDDLFGVNGILHYRAVTSDAAVLYT